MNVAEEVSRSKFLLILANENEYAGQLCELLKSLGSSESNKICYICASRPYKDVLEDLRKNGVDSSAISFIDLLSSHYGFPEPRKNCIFVGAPNDLNSIRDAIETLAERGCNIILLDTISTLLEYEARFPILSFTHSVAATGNSGQIKKVFLALKDNSVPQEDNNALIDDLQMFADKIIDISLKHKVI